MHHLFVKEEKEADKGITTRVKNVCVLDILVLPYLWMCPGIHLIS